MKQVELYNHNKTTYENITRIFETSNKCAAVQPTGSGKSFIIFKLAQDNSDKTIIVFEPNRQIIGRVSEQMKEYGIDNIKFYTYQKLNSQHKRDEISIANADYICLDELHRIKAKQWEQAVIAIQEKFPNAKVLGLTATPERMDGQNIIDYFGAELACNITLGDAIVNKILPCPTYISALYTFDEEIQKVSEKIDESKNSDEEKNEMRAELNEARKHLENAFGVPNILKKHIPNSNGKYIVFCQNVEHLNMMKFAIEDWFTQAGFETHTYEVHTKNPNHKTEYLGFKADNSNCIKLCLCVDMFNEGVHLEGISGVVLLRPTQSNIIYFQQIGRAISASDNNIPIIFDLVNNGNCLGGVSLRFQVETAVDRQRTEISNSDVECENEVFDIGDFHIYDYVKDSLDILNIIENKCVDDWNYHFQQFLNYKEKYGHGCVLPKESKEFVGLLEWSQTMRIYKKYTNTHKKEIDILTKNGFVFDVWEYHKTQLDIHLSEYMENIKTLPIPKDYIAPDGYLLGSKVQTAIKAYRRGINGVYDGILEKYAITSNYLDQKWNNYLNLVKEYILNGNIIKYNTIYKNKKIGQWYYNQLRLYRQNKLSTEKISEFKSLDLFNSKFDEKWDNNINIIIQCCNNNINIQDRTIYNGIKIGSRLRAMKQQFKKGIFPEERYQQLLELGIDLAKEGSLM